MLSATLCHGHCCFIHCMLCTAASFIVCCALLHTFCHGHFIFGNGHCCLIYCIPLLHNLYVCCVLPHSLCCGCCHFMPWALLLHILYVCCVVPHLLCCGHCHFVPKAVCCFFQFCTVYNMSRASSHHCCILLHYGLM